MHRIVRQGIPVLLAVGLLAYVLRGVPLSDLIRQFKQAKPGYVGLAALLILLFHLVRAARWQLVLRALGYSPSLFRTLIAMLAGALASMLVPGAGEFTRCGTLQRTDRIPLAQGLGSVVAERIVDLLALVLLIGLTLLLEYQRIGQYIIDLLSPVVARFSGQDVPMGIWILVGFLLFLLVALAYRLLRSDAFWQHRLIVRLLAVLRDLRRGFTSILRLKSPVLFVGLTLVSYGLMFLTTYVLFFALPQTTLLPAAAALTILTVSSVGGLAVPTQGGLGTYHFLVSRALVLYGISLQEGVIAATFLHGVQVGFSLLLSGISFLIIPLLIARRPTQEIHRQ